VVDDERHLHSLAHQHHRIEEALHEAHTRGVIFEHTLMSVENKPKGSLSDAEAYDVVVPNHLVLRLHERVALHHMIQQGVAEEQLFDALTDLQS